MADELDDIQIAELKEVHFLRVSATVLTALGRYLECLTTITAGTFTQRTLRSA